MRKEPNIRVLTIEDNAELAEAIAVALRRKDMAIDVAADGRAGLERALVSDGDVIVPDRNLPALHGDEVCSRRRHGRAWRDLLGLAGHRDRPTIMASSAELYGAVLNIDFDYHLHLDEARRDGVESHAPVVGRHREATGDFKIAGCPRHGAVHLPVGSQPDA